MRPVLVVVLGLCACKPKEPEVFRDPLWPFPNAELIDEGGHLAIPAGALPYAIDGTPVPVERLAWRTGFSVVQTSVVDVGVALDPSSLPGLDAIGTAGSVQMWDLTAGERIPCFAEIDAYPENLEIPVLIVRPSAPMTPGHRVAVAVTTDVRTAAGEPLAPLDWFAAALDGDPVGGIEGREDHYVELADELAALGVGELAVAWDFPIGDGTAPMREVAANTGVPTSFTIDDVRTSDTADLPDGMWMRMKGTYTTDDWLVDEGAFAYAADGVPVRQGETEAELYIYVPESARDAEPGTVPVWIFGHGIFSRPDDYLNSGDDEKGTVDLMNRAGVIIVATKWRGLTYTDLPTAIGVGNDFGRIPELTDKLVQGVGNTIALSRLVLEGGLGDAPELQGLPDTSDLRYMGISLGGIEGAVFMANTTTVPHAVLHVGGSAWSTMLERSSNWKQFETLVSYGVPSPRDRQLLYAASQLFWDEADPASYAADLRDRSVLWQESIGDEQVPNLTTELMARGVGATLVTPSVTTPWGLETSALPVTAPALVQYDPEVPLPPPTNRPAEVTKAHDNPRLWEGMKLQTMRFLDADDPGVIAHYCGDSPCSASNQGAP